MCCHRDTTVLDNFRCYKQPSVNSPPIAIIHKQMCCTAEKKRHKLKKKKNQLNNLNPPENVLCFLVITYTHKST